VLYHFVVYCFFAFYFFSHLTIGSTGKVGEKEANLYIYIYILLCKEKVRNSLRSCGPLSHVIMVGTRHCQPKIINKFLLDVAVAATDQ